MFTLFKKEPFKVVACAQGKSIKLEEVKDPVFSQKLMGDGFAIVPEGNEIVVPISGTVVALFPTKHAFGIKSKEGMEVLVHIGIDTVNLNGKGFTSLIKVGDKVKAGQKAVKLDLAVFEEENIDLTTMTIFTAGYDKEVKLMTYGQVTAGQTLIE